MPAEASLPPTSGVLLMQNTFATAHPIQGRKKKRVIRRRLSSWASRAALNDISVDQTHSVTRSKFAPYGKSSELKKSREPEVAPTPDDDVANATLDCLAFFQHHPQCLAAATATANTLTHKETSYDFKSRRRTLASIFDVLCKILHLRNKVRLHIFQFVLRDTTEMTRFIHEI
ncbi:unnamed protein product [Gongylonema pulchrum]|uniref:CDT1 domain-containing protein n=1 Tax=Gongylonema pulchrum TaxID=637853 RepID=A0A183D8G1_9BILA|nr:unnamed protein product [Gongylonema pulchrum]